MINLRSRQNALLGALDRSEHSIKITNLSGISYNLISLAKDSLDVIEQYTKRSKQIIIEDNHALFSRKNTEQFLSQISH